MSTPEQKDRGIEFDWKSVGNMLFKILALAGWTGVVISTASYFGWMGDGLNLTDYMALGMELGGAYVIGKTDGPLKDKS